MQQPTYKTVYRFAENCAVYSAPLGLPIFLPAIFAIACQHININLVGIFAQSLRCQWWWRAGAPVTLLSTNGSI